MGSAGRTPTEKYEGVWGALRDVAARVAADEPDLSRAVRLVEAEQRNLSLEPLGGIALGTPVTLPRAALFGGRRDLIQRALLEACVPETSMVVELGSGPGLNLLDLYLWGGPRVPYYALEPTESGRACTTVLAELDPDLDLRTAAYDYRRPDYEALPTGNPHVLVYTVQSIEQMTTLSREVVTGLFALGDRVTGVHFEPVGWQILEEPGTSQHGYATRQGFNRNLWPLLQELEREGELTIDSVAPNVFGHKVKNACTLIVWHAPAD
ncbi:MAG TPA: hypothetical protein VH816_00945 [Gaiellaceae bacterium]